jgi:hypothetical protein
MHERAKSAPVGFSPYEESQEDSKARFSDTYPVKSYTVGKFQLFSLLTNIVAAFPYRLYALRRPIPMEKKQLQVTSLSRAA